MGVVGKGYSVIKRIGLLIVVALVAAMMMVATSAPGFADPQNKTDCENKGGTWDNATKTCTGIPIGQSANTKSGSVTNNGSSATTDCSSGVINKPHRNDPCS